MSEMHGGSPRDGKDLGHEERYAAAALFTLALHYVHVSPYMLSVFANFMTHSSTQTIARRLGPASCFRLTAVHSCRWARGWQLIAKETSC